jgi:hypothetical protein
MTEAPPPPPPPGPPPGMPPGPPPGMPQGQQPYGAAPQNGMGTAALILSILGIIGCIPFVGGILGIVFGKMGMKNAEEGRANNYGQARAGFIIGIISLILWGVIAAIYIIVVVVAVANDPNIVNQ